MGETKTPHESVTKPQNQLSSSLETPGYLNKNLKNHWKLLQTLFSIYKSGEPNILTILEK